jgi:acetoin utilization protein AcuB
MLIKDIMTKPVVTAPGKTPIGEATKLMKDRRLGRLPVVDKDKLVGLVTRGRLERYFPQVRAHTLWQISHLIQQTTLADVMERNVVTIAPDATIEQAVALAQAKKVGSLLIVEKGKVLGIATTNDFFYNVVNPILGLGKAGTRIIVNSVENNDSIEAIIEAIKKTGVAIEVLWTVTYSNNDKRDLVIHLDTDNVTPILKELRSQNFSAAIRPR